ncbi:hypothetical protein [Moraxella lacunata]|uniref:hypothetical protein n=1 Tax=Moraxella lacunata TaxID=477 RepID=UPI003EDF25B3
MLDGLKSLGWGQALARTLPLSSSWCCMGLPFLNWVLVACKYTIYSLNFKKVIKSIT